MCLLIAKKAGTDLPENLEEICAEAAEANDDGFGFSTGDYIWRRPKIAPRKFAHVLRKKIKKEDNAIIHFRYSTSGQNNRDNTHPFQIKDGTIFAHNGVISDKYKPGNGRSDTATLAHAAENVTDLFWRCKELEGPSNKFAILSPSKELCIVGEQYGSWEKDGLWYSNDYWRRGNRRWSCYPTTYDYSDDYYDRDYTGLVGTQAKSYPTKTPPRDFLLESELSDLVDQYGFNNVREALNMLQQVFCS